MLVVADSSPLIVLVNIGQTGILPALFGEVVVPPEVSTELVAPHRPAAVQRFAAQPPAWLIKRAPSRIESIPALHAGELAAISLALELKPICFLSTMSQGARLRRFGASPSRAPLVSLNWRGRGGFLIWRTRSNA